MRYPSTLQSFMELFQAPTAHDDARLGYSSFLFPKYHKSCVILSCYTIIFVEKDVHGAIGDSGEQGSHFTDDSVSFIIFPR